MNKAFLYFVGIANVMLLASIGIGAPIALLITKLFSLEDSSTRWMIMFFSVTNIFLIWMWFSDTARKAFIELMQNK
jgi:hypothetical protein